MSHITETAICNIALQRLGEERIDSINEGSKASGLCESNMPFARRKTLRRFRWNFAKKTAILAQSQAPFIVWEYAYKLPADCVRMMTPLNKQGTPIEFFEREGEDILCNEPWAALVYIHDQDDLTRWDDLALDVLSLELATRIAVPITGSLEKRAAMLQELEQLILGVAVYVDACEDKSNENNPLVGLVINGKINRSRMGYVGGTITKGFDDPADS